MAKKGVRGRYVFLDLGEYFAAGRVINKTPQMITLEVVRDRRKFRPGYRRDTIGRIITIDERMANVLGPFSYPPDVSL